MNIQIAKFIGAYPKVEQMPKLNLPEFCFIGRSNVGKSSLLNYLSDKKKLAKVSSTPGKTQTLNIFEIDNIWSMVDMPGYGYAKRSKNLREEWAVNMKDYFTKRENLHYVFLLIDSRVPPQKSDLDLITWFGENSIPFVIIYTKADKRDYKNSLANINLVRKKLSESWDEIPQEFICSSEERTGKDSILEFLGNYINSINS